MGLTFKNGDMFSEPAEALVNTVNCVGVMGKGVALEFKRRWPENFRQYKALCDNNRLEPGKMFVFQNKSMFHDEHRYLINFPTKRHWRGKSELSYISDGLDDFVRQLRAFHITSVAMPPVGCGNGGLDWRNVKPIIEDKLGPLNDIEIVVFLPKEEISEGTNDAVAKKMTYERAILVTALARLESYFGGSYTRISLQKIVYFLQSLGIQFGFDFRRNLYGPYSEELRKAFLAMEKAGYISGFSSEERMITIDKKTSERAEDFLRKSGGKLSEEVLQKLEQLIEGYESPYGMELLSSVHFLANSENLSSAGQVTAAMKNWSERKGNEFDDAVIKGAFQRLRGDGFVRHLTPEPISHSR
ncbi:type II toxin-antitoxin system antitoxin DNA ADP-ribosyl glycohydrolase DarG [Mesorhizobium mediterraneum]|uniref:type II toxin-antitoxin system antitoxin DNA ADP-ribosyl glycohydrolase DarG n=1 Tax=Mesorhizobium mediterraneum TaxID=43617 RepID=UPI0017810F29|nr:macro domain-containing protein [Mesorhizobium mediterraneum]